MPQVSRYHLDKDVEKEMFQQFWVSLHTFASSGHLAIFFQDFLTSTERIMLAKRFAIGVLLLRGKLPSEIKSTIHVTNSAIGPVVQWLGRARPETRRMFERIIKDDSWQTFVDKIDVFIEQIPPRYGSNWSRAGREKWQQKKERAARNALR